MPSSRNAARRGRRSRRWSAGLSALAAWWLCLCAVEAGWTQVEVERVLLNEAGPATLERLGEVRLLYVEGSPEERVRQFGVLLAEDLQAMARELGRTEPELALDPDWLQKRGPAFARWLRVLALASGVSRPDLERIVAARLRDGTTPFPGLQVILHDGTRGTRWSNGFVPGVDSRELFLEAEENGSLLALDDTRAHRVPRRYLATDNGVSPPAEVLAVQVGRIEREAPRRRPPRTAEEARWLAPYLEDDEPFPFRLETVERGPEGEIAHLRFPSAVETGSRLNDVGFARWYRAPASDEPRPAIVLLHHLQNSFWLERSIAAELRLRGIDVALLHLPFYGRRRAVGFDARRMLTGGAEGLLRFGVQAHADVQRVRRFLLAQPEVSRVGLVGISLGGLLTAVIGGVEGTFPDVAPVLAGGPPELVLREGEREAAMLRRAFERAGIDVERDRDALRPLDPVAFAGRCDPKTVLMVNAEEDTVIPRAATLELWKAFGRPEIAWLPGTHITVAFQLPRILDRVEQHLLRSR